MYYGAQRKGSSRIKVSFAQTDNCALMNCITKLYALREKVIRTSFKIMQIYIFQSNSSFTEKNL